MKKNRPSVDIILPNYNSEQYIEQTIKSIINQNYKNWKLLLVDDCSNIKNRKILKKFAKKNKINIFFLNRNHGPGYCRNFGIKKSKSEYVAFIDSDDVWNKNKLSKQIKFMEENKYQFTYSNYKTFGLKQRRVLTPKIFTFNDFTKNTSIATSTMIVKGNIARKIKFINLDKGEDYYFKCEILKKVEFAYRVKDFLTNYRIRSNSFSSSKLKFIFWIWKINKVHNKFNFLKNLNSLILISLNSIKKYGFK